MNKQKALAAISTAMDRTKTEKKLKANESKLQSKLAKALGLSFGSTQEFKALSAQNYRKEVYA